MSGIAYETECDDAGCGCGVTLPEATTADPERHYVYAIVNTDAPAEERLVAVEKTRQAARASLDAGDWAHLVGRLRIRRGKLTLFQS